MSGDNHDSIANINIKTKIPTPDYNLTKSMKYSPLPVGGI